MSTSATHARQHDADLLLKMRESALLQSQGLINSVAEEMGIPLRQATEFAARVFGMQAVDTQALMTLEPDFRRWPLTMAQEQQGLLMRAPAQPSLVYVVTTDPFDSRLLERLEAAAGQPVEHLLTSQDDIHAYLHLQEASHRAMDQLDAPEETGAGSAAPVESLSLASVTEATSPAIKLVSSTLYDALRFGASDIHLESTPVGLAIKYRIDGVLDDIKQTNGQALAEQVISRLKVVANLDISERRIPQDGSYQVQAQGRLIDLRVSIMPSIHGEDAVIRILDKQSIIEAHGRLSLDALGFDGKAIAMLRNLSRAAYGMLLVTGPTGSGKTTTLYAALTETHNGREKIITIEDPVEYQLPGILQIPVNEKKGLTFARGLRSILRHDPDKIMVGEIRDKETAEIAVQSALTGHLVLSTVHANNVFDVFGRFTHMGLDPYALASALNGIWAQRLVRINCPSCSQPYSPRPEEWSGLEEDTGASMGTRRFMRGVGCAQCRGTGYKGRRAIAEALLLDDEIKEMITSEAPVRQIKEHARRKGFATLQRSALALVYEGQTTLDEVRRVTLSI